MPLGATFDNELNEIWKVKEKPYTRSNFLSLPVKFFRLIATGLLKVSQFLVGSEAATEGEGGKDC